MDWNKTFNAYLEMAIREGWTDPVGFASRRMAELKSAPASRTMAPAQVPLEGIEEGRDTAPTAECPF
jgi:hypothetical protein